MPQLASKLGIRLLLLLGKDAPLPAPAIVMTALQHTKITSSIEGKDNGFELVFSTTKSKLGEFDLLRGGNLDPDTRVVIGLQMGVQIYPIMDGIIQHRQLVPGQDAGVFVLTVQGQSVASMLDLEQRTAPYPNQKHSDIVKSVIAQYAQYGITCGLDVQTTSDQPSDGKRVASQNATDHRFINKLAQLNGYVFFIEPDTLGTSKVFFGPVSQTSNTLPPLSVDLGPATNVTRLHFGHDTLAPVKAVGNCYDASAKQVVPVQAPPVNTGVAVSDVTQARRTVRMRCAARRGPSEAQNVAAGLQALAPDSTTAQGELETLRYGDVLRPYHVVAVRGAGHSYDGDYLIRQVTHEIEVGKCIQQFTLSRKGLQASI